MLITDNNTQAPTATFKETTPLQGAVAMARRGLRITPLRGKAPFLSGWQESATTDIAQIKTWAEQYPGCNFGCVFKRGEFWGLDEDIAGVVDMFVKETRIPIDTFRVESSAGRYHWYFKSTEDSDARLTNIRQNNFAAGAASVRFDREQCVCPFSVHPEKLTVYRPVGVPAPAIAEAPKEFVSWLLDQRTVVTKPPTQQPAGQPRQQIMKGGRDTYLFQRACALRAAGLEQDEIETIILRENEELCVPPMSIEEAKKCAKQGSKYQKGDPTPTTLIGGKIPGENVIQPPSAQPATKTRELLIDESEGSLRPIFPYHVMEGTSLYEGLVKPVVDNSSKHAEFVFMPAVQMMLNYLAGKVKVAMQDTNLNLYIGLISPPGKFFKSSSCTLTHDYYKSVGLAIKHSKSLPSADGRVVVMQTGSSEGFGTTLSELNGKHAILFNDELGKLVAKAGIENSSLPHDLLTWYESGDFGNTVKSKKDCFAFEAGSYTFGWQWCTTTRGFNRHWPKIAGVVSGMEDRMFFVLSPEEPKPAGSYSTPQTRESAKRTFELIEKALLKATYHFASYEEVQSLVYGMNPRTMQMLFALALYFAIDLDRETIDSECVQRAKQLVDFRDQAILFLAPIEADNEQGRMQQEIIRELRQHKGKLKYRDLCRELHSDRFGSDRWRAGYKGLVGEGIIADYEEKTRSGQTTRMTALLVLND